MVNACNFAASDVPVLPQKGRIIDLQNSYWDLMSRTKN